MNFLEIIEKANASRLGFILLHLRRVIKITGGFGGGAVWGSPLKATGRGLNAPLFIIGPVSFVVVSSPQCGENTAFFSGFPLGGSHG
ncbi:MAG: hypothetical protein KH745_06195 [Bilophila sp.]|nr:hypothetical protein [Bilophila sp.]